MHFKNWKGISNEIIIKTSLMYLTDVEKNLQQSSGQQCHNLDFF